MPYSQPEQAASMSNATARVAPSGRLHFDSAGGQQPVRARGAEDDRVEFARRHAGALHRDTRSLGADARERLALARDVPLADARALTDPLIRRVDPDGRELRVGEDPLGDRMSRGGEHGDGTLHLASCSPMWWLMRDLDGAQAREHPFMIASGLDLPWQMMLTPFTPSSGAPPYLA
jgi:hypothetical protein